MAQPELNWTEVDSSNVERVGYHEDTETLAVLFRNGGLYTYKHVDMEVFVGLTNAASVGRYLNNEIKGVYAYEKHYSMLDLENNLASK